VVKFAALCSFLLLLCFAATGQEFRAGISGVVTDSSGGAINGAEVVATNVETNASRAPSHPAAATT